MLSDVFKFLISNISKCVEFLFTIKINNNPNISLGMFLLACCFIGVVIYFILGTDFVPNFINNRNNGSRDNYNPRHSIGNAGKDFSTRESRHNYK